MMSAPIISRGVRASRASSPNHYKSDKLRKSHGCNREKKLRHDKLSRQFFVRNLSNLVVILVEILVAKAILAKKSSSNITTKLPSFDTMTKTVLSYSVTSITYV